MGTEEYDTLLKNQFVALADAVTNKDAELVRSIADSALELVNKRNAVCKASK